MHNLEAPLRCPSEGGRRMDKKTWNGLGNQPKQTQPTGMSHLINLHYRLHSDHRTEEHGSSIAQETRPPPNYELPPSSHDIHRGEGASIKVTSAKKHLNSAQHYIASSA